EDDGTSRGDGDVPGMRIATDERVGQVDVLELAARIDEPRRRGRPPLEQRWFQARPETVAIEHPGSRVGQAGQRSALAARVAELVEVTQPRALDLAEAPKSV